MKKVNNNFRSIMYIMYLQNYICIDLHTIYFLILSTHTHMHIHVHFEYLFCPVFYIYFFLSILCVCIK